MPTVLTTSGPGSHGTVRSNRRIASSPRGQFEQFLDAVAQPGEAVAARSGGDLFSQQVHPVAPLAEHVEHAAYRGRPRAAPPATAPPRRSRAAAPPTPWRGRSSAGPAAAFAASAPPGRRDRPSPRSALFLRIGHQHHRGLALPSPAAGLQQLGQLVRQFAGVRHAPLRADRQTVPQQIHHCRGQSRRSASSSRQSAPGRSTSLPVSI